MSLSRRATIALVAAFGVTLVGVPSALSAAWQPWADPGGDSGLGKSPITKVPADEPERGLVYSGLKAAKKGTPCVGGYETADRNTCSHGPDAAPPGLDPATDVKPIAAPAAKPKLPARDEAATDEATIVADEGAVGGDGTLALVPDAAPAAQLAVGPNGVVCDGDGNTGKRVHVMYVYAAGTASRYDQYLPSFRTWAAGVDTIYNASAQETGGVRHLRYVTTAGLPGGGLRGRGADRRDGHVQRDDQRAAGAGLQPHRPQVHDLRRVAVSTAASARSPATTGPARPTAATAARRTAAATAAAGPPASPRTSWGTTSARSTTARRTPARPGTASTSTTSCATRTPTPR